MKLAAVCWAALAVLAGATAQQQEPASVTATVTFAPSCLRNIGGVTELRREQFFTIHASPDEHEITDADFRFLVNELEVSFGREGGSRSWWRSQTPAAPKGPDFPDIGAIRRFGRQARDLRIQRGRNNPAHWREMILCTHPESFYARPDNNSAPWGPRSVEGAAEFTARYLKAFWNDDERPRYLEVFNEPFIKLKKLGGTMEDLCRQHVAVARRVRELCPKVLVGGPAQAWPEFQLRGFQHWTSGMKRFMDLAGPEMDLFSTHIYDGTDKEWKVGTYRRTGSNAEAILDLIDAYSFLRFGAAKSQVILEFGLIPTPPGVNGRPYDPTVAGQMVHTTIAQLMMFMDHPDRIIKVVPFILAKANWTYELEGCSEETPYPFLLWRKKGGKYLLTDLALYYRFWKGLRGRWLWSTSSDPDVGCHLFDDRHRLFAVLCNLDDHPHAVGLVWKGRPSVARASLRSFSCTGDGPQLVETQLSTLPTTLRPGVGEAAMLVIVLRTAPPVRRQVHECRCYADTCLQDIEANRPVTFHFTEVPVGQGTAVLRFGLSRPHGHTLRPSVRVNGQAVPTPADWAGDDQRYRNGFFGVIEVPVPMELITSDTRVECTFPDSGGKVASAVLQVNRVEPVPARRENVTHMLPATLTWRQRRSGKILRCSPQAPAEEPWSCGQRLAEQ